MKPIADLPFRLLFLLLFRLPLAGGEIYVVALGGDPMPDGTGQIYSGTAAFTDPVLSNEGVALFEADIMNATDYATESLMVGIPGGTALVARLNYEPSSLTGIGQEHFDRFYHHAQGDAGVVGFMTRVVNNGTTYALMNAGSDPAGYGVHTYTGQLSPDEGSLALD